MTKEILNEKHKSIIDGYDWAVETINEFFASHFVRGVDDDRIAVWMMLQTLPKCEKERFYAESPFKWEDGEPKLETLIDYARAKLMDYCESQRNILIASLLEAQRGT